MHSRCGSHPVETSSHGSVEKTKRLLFRGAQAYMDHMWDESCATGRLPGSAKHGQESPRAVCALSGQMLIGQDGKLLRRCAQATNDTDSSEGMSKACSSCVRTVRGKEACSQCDRFLCQSCIKICYGCNTMLCSLCAVVNYSDIGESALCRGCSMFEA
ncbi:apoptosis regulatory protein Siva isoform X2 [Phascolarctos cinereus]|uniref:Apoptosis regulatory protein Siva isoform X2 n=1 Tax=Phascolarctos cinereus TaxID=38626 RepID=A0A6P5JLH7_PHACI|nr:apoptosis regulatory protein Siva isoform X2 [Phascolarctos cinereus]